MFTASLRGASLGGPAGLTGDLSAGQVTDTCCVPETLVRTHALPTPLNARAGDAHHNPKGSGEVVPFVVAPQPKRQVKQCLCNTAYLCVWTLCVWTLRVDMRVLRVEIVTVCIPIDQQNDPKGR